MNSSFEQSAPQLKILFVDDDHNDRALFGVAVDQSDLNILLATLGDGQEAIDYLQGRDNYGERSLHPQPDLLVMDLRMQRVDGFEFLSWWQQAGLRSTMPIVLFCGPLPKIEIERALALGASRFIPKPLAFRDWVDVVREIWDFGLASREVRPAGSAAPAPSSQWQEPKSR